jgi:hypothetical protein
MKDYSLLSKPELIKIVKDRDKSIKKLTNKLEKTNGIAISLNGIIKGKDAELSTFRKHICKAIDKLNSACIILEGKDGTIKSCPK